MKRSYLLVPLLIGLLIFVGCDSSGTVSTSTTPSTSTPTSGVSSTVSDATTTSTPSEGSSTTATPVSGEGATYTAELTGNQVVPPISTEATGSATFTVDPTGTRVRFSLEVSNMTDVDSSRVRQGAMGTNGSGVVVLLSGRYGAGVFTGTVASGSFDASALIGQLKGKTIADFVALMASGQAYVSVGTVENPGGEIRGQIH